MIHRSWFALCVGVLLVFLLFSACVQRPGEVSTEHESIEPAEVPAEEPVVKTEFTRGELLKDYDQLWEILEENYPFFPVLEEHGLDCVKLRESFREELANCRSTDLKDFASLLRRMFGQMENLAHLGLVDDGILPSYYSYYQDSGLDSPEYELITAPQTRASYALLSQGKETGAEEAYPEVETRYYPDCKAAYFHFRTFSYTLIERDAAVISDYLSTLDGVEHIIIDITGNSGGSDYYPIQNIIEPIGGEVSWTSYSFMDKSPLTERFILRDDPEKARPLSELPEDAVYPEFAEELGMIWFTADTFRVGGENSGCAPEAKRWLLIDSGVYSASESFAVFCKETGWAALVGTRTSGDGACHGLPGQHGIAGEILHHLLRQSRRFAEL